MLIKFIHLQSVNLAFKPGTRKIPAYSPELFHYIMVYMLEQFQNVRWDNLRRVILPQWRRNQI